MSHIHWIIQNHNKSKSFLPIPQFSGSHCIVFYISLLYRAAVDLDIRIGWDLAHAVGNIQLKMHEWGADFAVWCSYKYLNSGAGGISGVFFHNKHHNNPPTHLQGWWSNKQVMENSFII